MNTRRDGFRLKGQGFPAIWGHGRWSKHRRQKMSNMCWAREREREKERCRTTGKFIHDHPNIWRARASQIADKKAVCGRGGARNRNFMFPDQTKWALWVTSCGVGIERGLFNFADSWRPKCISLHLYLLYKKPKSFLLRNRSKAFFHSKEGSICPLQIWNVCSRLSRRRAQESGSKILGFVKKNLG